MLKIICLKHGTKYSSDYVNRLFNMVSRHLSLSHEFICFTDDKSGINPNITIIPLPKLNYTGWWWKPYLFNVNHYNDDTVLYIDLDMVIINSLDSIALYDGSFVGLQDVSRVFGYPEKLCSAIMKWQSSQWNSVWEIFQTINPQSYKGDQDYIWHYFKQDIQFFPYEWIKSYKWEIRTKDELVKVNGINQFRQVRDPVIPDDVAILAFHGTPNPQEVNDPVIVTNWT